MKNHSELETLQDNFDRGNTGQQSEQPTGIAQATWKQHPLRWAFIGIVIQATLLMGMIGMAFYPLWVGTPIRLQTVPVDPRNLFRGNYLELNYALNRLNLDSIPNDLPRYPQLRPNDVVYIELEPDKMGIHQAIGVWSERPTRSANPCLRARIDGRYMHQSEPTITVETDVQHFFASPDSLKLYERQQNVPTLESTTPSPNFTIIVKAKVTNDGRARLLGLIKIDSLPQNDSSLSE